MVSQQGRGADHVGKVDAEQILIGRIMGQDQQTGAQELLKLLHVVGEFSVQSFLHAQIQGVVVGAQRKHIFGQQGLFAVEVLIKAANRDAGTFCNIRNRSRRKAFAAEQGDSGGKNAFPGALCLNITGRDADQLLTYGLTVSIGKNMIQHPNTPFLI